MAKETLLGRDRGSFLTHFKGGKIEQIAPYQIEYPSIDDVRRVSAARKRQADEAEAARKLFSIIPDTLLG